VWLFGTAASYLFAWTLPDRFHSTDNAFLYFVAAQFFLRVFQLHIAVAALVPAVVLALLIGRRRLGVAHLALLMLLLAPIVSDALPRTAPSVPATAPTLVVMSANLWAPNDRVDLIAAEIERVDPDLIVLVETGGGKWFAIRKQFATKYPHVVLPEVGFAGIVMSKRPIRQASEPSIAAGQVESNPVMPVVAELDGREFSIYPVHMRSPGSRHHLAANRLQVLILQQAIDADPRPALIAGDLNMTPLTPNYQGLTSRGHRSSHTLAGSGLAGTWATKRLHGVFASWFPGIRIDHILVPKEMTALSHEVGHDVGSDHRPVIARITWKPN
jgi:endonuclease/exonuclease/phosphatase (EEP) superfamily protein YafD